VVLAPLFLFTKLKKKSNNQELLKKFIGGSLVCPQCAFLVCWEHFHFSFGGIVSLILIIEKKYKSHYLIPNRDLTDKPLFLISFWCYDNWNTIIFGNFFWQTYLF